MKNLLISLFLCCSATLLLCGSVSAQSPTSPPTPTPLSTQIDEEKIQEIRDQVREKIQEKINQIKEKGKRRAYVGKILTLDGLKITLDTRRGEREITVDTANDKEAAIIGAGRKKIDLENLKVGDLLICMGFVDPEGKMLAKRIVVIPKPPKPPISRRAVFGQVTKVTEVDENSQILTLIHPRKEDMTLQVKAANQARITKKVKGKIQKAKFSDIEVNDRLIAIGTWNEEGKILTAKLIHVIPSKSNSEL